MPRTRTMQVLNAWKQLVDSKQQAVLMALNGTDWHARARLATSHPKQLVVSAATKLLAACHDSHTSDAGLGVYACMQQLAALQVRALFACVTFVLLVACSCTNIKGKPA